MDEQSLSMEFVEESLEAVPLDDVEKEDFLREVSPIAKKWSAWTVIERKEMVSVILQNCSRGIKATSMNCKICRSEKNRRCRKEIVCDNESQKQVNVGDASDDSGGSSDSQLEGEMSSNARSKSLCLKETGQDLAAAETERRDKWNSKA